MSAMDINIHSSFLPQTDSEASKPFYRDTLGFEVRNEVGYNDMYWITVGPKGQPTRASSTMSGARSPR